MQSHENDKIDPIGYLVAPLVSPTLNIVFVPIFDALGGHPEFSGESVIWMVIAWFGLEAICLATLYPLLWLLRHALMRLQVSVSAAVIAAVSLSGVASYLLFGTAHVAHATPLSWLAAAAASAFAFIAYQKSDMFTGKELASQ